MALGIGATTAVTIGGRLYLMGHAGYLGDGEAAEAADTTTCRLEPATQPADGIIDVLLKALKGFT